MRFYPVRIALIAAIGGLLFGFETVVISGAEQTLEHLWSLNSFTQGFTVASSILGTILGSVFAWAPAKRYGRKKVLQAMACMFIVAALGCAFVSAWALFISFRMLGGLAVGASSVIAPMYISEISPASMRGRLAGSFQFNIVAGILIAYLTNYLFVTLQLPDAWRWMLGVMVVPAIAFIILLTFIPESPRWLVLEGREREAIPVLERLGEIDVEGMIASIKESAKEHQDRLFQRRYSKPILYAVLLAMFNQLAGINAILYYAPRIFKMAGFSEAQSFSQPIYIGVANFIFTLLAMAVIDKYGRKRLLVIGSLGMILFLGLTAYAFQGDVTGKSYLLYYLIGFIAFFAFSQGAVIWVFISEIFPNSVRSQGVSLGSTTHWVMAAIISWVFPFIVEHFKQGGMYSFAFFCAMMVLHLVFVWKVLPETKGKTLEQIQQELGIK